MSGPQGNSPEIQYCRLPKGWLTWKAASLGAQWRATGETDGVVDCGTFKEDTPETWETPDLP
jgi:hypothetical protein